MLASLHSILYSFRRLQNRLRSRDESYARLSHRSMSTRAVENWCVPCGEMRMTGGCFEEFGLIWWRGAERNRLSPLLTYPYAGIHQVELYEPRNPTTCLPITETLCVCLSAGIKLQLGAHSHKSKRCVPRGRIPFPLSLSLYIDIIYSLNLMTLHSQFHFCTLEIGNTKIRISHSFQLHNHGNGLIHILFGLIIGGRTCK